MFSHPFSLMLIKVTTKRGTNQKGSAVLVQVERATKITDNNKYESSLFLIQSYK